MSYIGTGVSQIALPLLVLMITHSPAQAGFIAAIQALPYVLFVLPAGALLDRWNRKKVMVYSDIGRALCLVSIPFALAFGHLTVVQISIVVFIEGTFQVFFEIAELSCLPLVVSKEQLPAALSRSQATVGITSLIGPPLGGTLFTIRSFLPFLGDAVTYMLSVFSLLMIRVPFQEERAEARRNLLKEIKDGLVWLRHQPVIFWLSLMTGGNILFTAGYSLIIIVMVQPQHNSSIIIGLIFGIGGIGGILGALVASEVQRRCGFSPVILGTMWLFALLWVPLVAFPTPFLLSLITAAVFFLSPLYSIASVSYRLGATPDDLQSRVNSVSRLIAFIGRPIGLALTGILLQQMGPRFTSLLCALGLGLLALASTANGHIRNARSLTKELPRA